MEELIQEWREYRKEIDEVNNMETMKIPIPKYKIGTTVIVGCEYPIIRDASIIQALISESFYEKDNWYYDVHIKIPFLDQYEKHLVLESQIIQELKDDPTRGQHATDSHK